MAFKYMIYDQVYDLINPVTPILIVDEYNNPLGNISESNVSYDVTIYACVPIAHSAQSTR